MPADGEPIVGPVAEVPGLYLAVMHSAVTLAAAVGRLVARELVDGTVASPLRAAALTASSGSCAAGPSPRAPWRGRAAWPAGCACAGPRSATSSPVWCENLRVRSRASPTMANPIPPSRITPAPKISTSCQVFRPPLPVVLVASGGAAVVGLGLGRAQGRRLLGAGGRREGEGEHEGREGEQRLRTDRHGRRV